MTDSQIPILTVSEINSTIKDILTKKLNTPLSITGEISNMKRYNNNIFLTLKDEESTINVTMWKKSTDAQNGDTVIVTGTITCYIKGGTYQITASSIKKVGQGSIHTHYEQLKQEFNAKGYFNKSKISIPSQIYRIAILTARSGAAIEDILYVLKQNHFTGEILIKNCIVQGQACPNSIYEGIQFFNNLHLQTPIDALIVGRGGGSFEDLMGYSSELAVRAIHESPIFIISAVGHEVDTMLSDLAANIRAPTPSIAAELITSSECAMRTNITNHTKKLAHLFTQISLKLATIQDKIITLEKDIAIQNPLKIINDRKETLEHKRNKIHSIINHRINILSEKLKTTSILVANSDPKNALKKGYAMILDHQGNIIDTHIALNQNHIFRIIFNDGSETYNIEKLKS